MQYDLVKIGERIRQERKKIFVLKDDNRIPLAYSSTPKEGCKKCTQEDLSAILQYNYGLPSRREDIIRLEKGNHNGRLLTFDRLAAFTEIFDCEMGYLLCEPGYEQKTRALTDIQKATGLTPEAIQKLQVIQTYIRDDFGYLWKIEHNEEQLEYYKDYCHPLMDVFNFILGTHGPYFAGSLRDFFLNNEFSHTDFEKAHLDGAVMQAIIYVLSDTRKMFFKAQADMDDRRRLVPRNPPEPDILEHLLYLEKPRYESKKDFEAGHRINQEEPEVYRSFKEAHKDMEDPYSEEDMNEAMRIMMESETD